MKLTKDDLRNIEVALTILIENLKNSEIDFSIAKYIQTKRKIHAMRLNKQFNNFKGEEDK